MVGIEIGNFQYDFAEGAAAPCTATEKALGDEMTGGAASCSIEGVDTEPTSVKGLSYWEITQTAAPTKLITETSAPTSDNIMYSNLITKTSAPTSDNILYSNLITQAPTSDNLFHSKITSSNKLSSHRKFTEAAETGFSCCYVKEAEAPTSERGFFLSRITEAVAPSSERGVFVNPITETTAPSLENGFSHYKIKEAAAPTSERGVSYCKITQAGVPTSEKGVFLNSITEIAAPGFENGVFYSQNKDSAAPTSEKGVSICMIKGAGVPTLEKGVFLNSITEIAASSLENGVSYYQKEDSATPTLERGVSLCSSKGKGVHTAEEVVIFKSISEVPAPTSENGVSYYQNKDTAAPTSERGVLHCKINGARAHTAEEGVIIYPITETAAPALENEVCYEDAAAPTSERGVSYCKITETGVPTSEKGVSLNLVIESAAPALENGVSYYKHGFPDVLRPPSPRTNDFKVSLYAYIIHYSVLQEGQDPINIAPPTQFVLLNHFLLDEEVAHHFSVRLNLPHQECIAAHLTPCDMISLTLDQVNIVEVFNGVLFSTVCLRSKLDFEHVDTVENKTKGYYVMPLKDGVDMRTKAKVSGLIDWSTACDLVHCNLNMKKWKHYPATMGPDTDCGFLNDTGAFVKGWLGLKCGFYKEEDLIDAFVTYGPFNTSCFIVGISDKLCGLSIMQGSECCLSYKDYWLKRFEVELKNASQPLLVGYCLSHAGNFLQRPSQAVLDPPNISVHQKLFGAMQKQRESLFLQRSVFYRQDLRAVYGEELSGYHLFFVV